VKGRKWTPQFVLGLVGVKAAWVQQLQVVSSTGFMSNTFHQHLVLAVWVVAVVAVCLGVWQEWGSRGRGWGWVGWGEG